jgi:hypothetical protein
MTLLQDRRSVGVFRTRSEAETALAELRAAGFDMDRVSVIAKDADKEGSIADVDVDDKHSIGNKADDGAKAGAVTGGALGGLTGLLVGLGALAIPGIGPIIFAGAEATALATTLAGGAIGAAAGGLLGALVGLGIPEERARVYNDRVSRGEYLVIVDGNETEIRRARDILHHHGIEEYGVYDIPGNHGTVGGATAMSARDTDMDTAMSMDRSRPMTSGYVADRPMAYDNETNIDRDLGMNPTPTDTSRYNLADEEIADRRVTDTTPVVNTEPEVIIIDRRDETDPRINK